MKRRCMVMRKNIDSIMWEQFSEVWEIENDYDRGRLDGFVDALKEVASELRAEFRTEFRLEEVADEPKGEA